MTLWILNYHISTLIWYFGQMQNYFFLEKKNVKSHWCVPGLLLSLFDKTCEKYLKKNITYSQRANYELKVLVAIFCHYRDSIALYSYYVTG